MKQNKQENKNNTKTLIKPKKGGAQGEL